MMSALTIGHDAEVFVQDADGKIQSAIGLIGGTKEKPLEVRSGALQEDNVLAELNIVPATNFKQFQARTAMVLEQLKAMLPPGWEPVIKSSHVYEKSDLRGFGEAAMQFGCDPDYNCWTHEMNQASSPFTTLRTAGGHIHIGHDKSVDRHRIAQMADYMMGLPSVLLDDDTDRRALYGAAGAYRPKPYGTEYRTLSNFWLANEDHMHFIFDQAVKCAEEVSELNVMRKVVSPERIVTAINNSDRESAAMYCRQLGIKV